MKKLVLFLTAFMLVASAATAQQVKGIVKDPQGKAVEKATVSLLKGKDSSVVKLAVTASDGKYNFSVAEAGSYLISVSHIGFTTVYSAPLEVPASGETAIPDLALEKSTGDLGSVTVSSKKPMVEVRADKTVLNVEGTINATGTDVLGLLRKSPGVLVDKDDNLSLAGKNGVKVYIDGKPTPLAGADLANYLKSIQSSQVEAIELITNPSAKYDAAGNAGIINIKLKKNKAFGTNGSVNAGYNIGVYPKYNADINFNHRNKGVNVFGNYSYSDNKINTVFNIYRSVLDTIFNNSTDAIMGNKSHVFKTGADFFIDTKSTFGVLVNGNISENSFNNYSRTPISYKPTGVVDRVLVANNVNKVKGNNVNFNLNYRFADTSGHELNLDADYGLFRNKGNQLQPNFYYNADGYVAEPGNVPLHQPY